MAEEEGGKPMAGETCIVCFRPSTRKDMVTGFPICDDCGAELDAFALKSSARDGHFQRLLRKFADMRDAFEKGVAETERYGKKTED